MNATNMLERVNAQWMRFRVWLACRLWAKLIAGVLLLAIMGVIQVPIGVQAGLPVWLTIIVLLVAYLMYCALTGYLHWKYTQVLIQSDRADRADCQGVPYDLSYDHRQQDIIRQLEQLRVARQHVQQIDVFPKGCTGYPIFIGTQELYRVIRPSASQVEQTDDERGASND
jgi:hypothetical protein